MKKKCYTTGAGFCLVLLLVLFIVYGCATAPRSAQPSLDFDVIVIGAGLGGLSAGTHLGVNGYKVLVLEQHDKVGVNRV